MTHWKKAFPGKYLQTSDLDVPILATIDRVSTENIGDDGTRKLVVRFEDPNVKALIVNQTRAEAIATIAGSEDIDDWPDTRIQIERGLTRFQGKRVACIVVVQPPHGDDDDPEFVISSPTA
jgi:hypothetical protein